VATTEIRAHVSILKLSSTVRILVVGARHPIESTSAQLQWGPQPYSSTRVAECVLLVGEQNESNRLVENYENRSWNHDIIQLILHKF
jgi:hypothetical protein